MAHVEQLHHEPDYTADQHTFEDHEQGWEWADPAPRYVHGATQEFTPAMVQHEGPVRDYTDRGWAEWAGPVPARTQNQEPLEQPASDTATPTEKDTQSQQDRAWEWADPVSDNEREDIRRKAFDNHVDTSKTENPKHEQKAAAEQTQQEIDDLIAAFDKRFAEPNEQSVADYRAKKDALFQELGFKPHESKAILRSWASYNPDRKDVSPTEEHEIRRKAFRSNLESIAAIEKMDPGAAAALHHIYGIRNFTRFNPAELVQQLHAANTGSAEVIMAATDDWNNSFSGEGELAKARHEVFMESPVYVEAARPIEAFVRLAQVKQRHGSIKRVVAAGHGSEDSLQLSTQNESITADSLKRTKAIEDLIERGVLDPDAAIILSSCEGMKLAQEISKQTEGLVVASGTSSDGLYQRTQNERDYHDNSGAKAKIYEKGRRTDGIRRVRRLGQKALAAFKLAA